jgi:hypothetical protein
MNDCGHVRLWERNGLSPSTFFIQRMDCLMCENERLKSALQEIADSGAAHPWGGPAPFARQILDNHKRL